MLSILNTEKYNSKNKAIMLQFLVIFQFLMALENYVLVNCQGKSMTIATPRPQIQIKLECILMGVADETNISINGSQAISHCTTCGCNQNGIITCYFTDITGRQKEICTNCEYTPEDKCPYCRVPESASIKGGTLSVRHKRYACVKCVCDEHGTLSCRYDVGKLDNKSMKTKQCNSYDDCKVMIGDISNGIDKDYQCKNCQDGESTRQARDEWQLKSMTIQTFRVMCFCNNYGDIECKTGGAVMGIYFTHYCEKCSKSEALELFSPKDCHLQGITFKHGQFKYVEAGGVPFCAQCACHLGEIRCIGAEKLKQVTSKYGNLLMFHQLSCSNETNCTALMESKQLEEECRDDMKSLICPNHPVSWFHKGCHFSCFNQVLSYNEIEERWCEPLIEGMEKCIPCPDKTEFMKKFGPLIKECQDKKHFIWKDQLCDGRNDCGDESDEANCTTFQCGYSVSKFHQTTWSSTQVSQTAFQNCSLVNESWSGMTSRTCLMNSIGITYWSVQNICDCHIVFPPFKTVANKSYEDSLSTYLSGTVLKNLEFSPSKIQHMKFFLNVSKYLGEKYGENVTLPLLSNDDMKIRSLLQNILYFGRKIVATMTECRDGETIQLESNITEMINKIMGRHSLLVMIATTKPIVLKQTIATFIKKTDYMQKMLDEASLREKALALAKKDNITEEEAYNMVYEKAKEHAKEESKKMDAVLILDNFFAGCSLVSLMIGLLVFRILRVKNTLKVVIHQNLMLITLIMIIVHYTPQWIAPGLSQKSQEACTVVGIISYYTKMSTWCWMLVEGINLVLVVVLVFKRKRKGLREMMIIGYGFPMMITAVASGSFFDAFKTSTDCVSMNGSLWIVKAPMSAILFVNLVIFTLILAYIWKNAGNVAAKGRTTSPRTRSSTRAFLILLPLLGMPQILAIFVEYSIVLQYIYVCIAGLSGFFLLICHVLMDPKVKENFGVYGQRLSKRAVSSSNQSAYYSNSQTEPSTIDLRMPKT